MSGMPGPHGRIGRVLPMSARTVLTTMLISLSAGAASVGTAAPAAADVPPARAAEDLTSPTDTPAATEAGCQVRYRASIAKPYYSAAITIANTGNVVINGWTFVFPLHPEQTVQAGWNATYSVVDATIVANNLPSNAVLEPGNSLSVYFRGTTGTTVGTPAWFTVNGHTCSVAG